MTNEKSLVDRLKKESVGYAHGKSIPQRYPRGVDYRTVGKLNIDSEDKDYLLKNGLMVLTSERAIRNIGYRGYSTLDNKQLFTGPTSHFHRDSGDEFLEISPRGNIMVIKEDIVLPVEVPIFEVGHVRFGNKRTEEHFPATFIEYKKGGNAAIFYYGGSNMDEPGRGDFLISIELNTPERLAKEFMEYAKCSPNDVWKILSEELFPGTFGVERIFNDREFKDEPCIVPPVKRSGVMYIKDLSVEALKKAGFEFGIKYLSRKDPLYNAINFTKKGYSLEPSLDVIMSRIPYQKVMYTPS